MLGKYGELLQYMRANRSAKVTELSKALFLSEATVRRVLDKLEAEGKLRRFHGGATLIEDHDDAFIMRRQFSLAKEKQAIGRVASELVRDGMTLLMMGGSTVQALCPFLRGKKLTVITSSIPVASALAWEEHISVIMLGGVLNPAEMEVRGHLSSMTLEHLRADMMFIGTTGLHPIHGVMTDDPNSVEAYTTCMRVCDEVVVLADHSKLEQYMGTTVQCGLDKLDALVVDDGVKPAELNYYRERMRKVYAAPVNHDGEHSYMS